MFRFEKRSPRNFVIGFEHGRYGDAWSLLHLTTGLTVGVIAILLGWHPGFALTFSMFIMFLYELGESLVDIVEDVENAITDVLFGGLGVGIMYLIHTQQPIEWYIAWQIFVLLILIDILLLYLGWRAFLGKRIGEKDAALLPSWKTAAGRRQIKRDQLYFFGFGFSSIPVPWLVYEIGWLAAASWFVGCIIITVMLRRAV